MFEKIRKKQLTDKLAISTLYLQKVFAGKESGT
jgi:hypothetical protein